MQLMEVSTEELRAELARRSKASIAKIDPTAPLAAAAARAAAASYGVRPAAVFTASRRQPLVLARWAAWHVLSLDFGKSQALLARLFSRDHAAILHGCREAENLILTSARFRDAVAAVRLALESMHPARK